MISDKQSLLTIDRRNNFDFLRLVLAAFVLITHSFVLAEKSECDWLCQITSSQVVFSYLGVRGFFVVSGYLIFQSLQRSHGLIDYLWKRVLRLIPGLVVMLICCAILGVFVYDHSQGPYFTNRSVWTYPIKNLLIFNSQTRITGIFEQNPFPSVINGSLWTIKYEVAMYLSMCLLLFTRKRLRLTITLLAVSTGFLIILNILFSGKLSGSLMRLNIGNLTELAAFFVAGSFLASTQFEKAAWRDYATGISLLIMIASLCFNMFDYAKYFTIPIVMIGIGAASWPVINNVGKAFGDLSYGLYIYGFPVQQTLVYFLRPSHSALLAYSAIVTIIFAYLSWHIVEFRALELKSLPMRMMKRYRKQNPL